MIDLRGILKTCLIIQKELNRGMRTVGSPQKRTSNRSKLKAKKASPNIQYKSSKPKKAQEKTTFRNKSNL